MKKLLIFCVFIPLYGCSTPTRMSVKDLSEYKIDCDNRYEQHQFLESQKYTNDQRFNLGLQMTSVLGIISNVYRGTADDSSAGMNGEHEAMIKAQQRQLRQRCLLEDSYKKSQ
jgi:hypothetical protein